MATTISSLCLLLMVVLCFMDVDGKYCSGSDYPYPWDKNYCAYGCCVNYNDGCCPDINTIRAGLTSAVIAVIVVSSLFAVGLIISCIVCLYCCAKKRPGNPGTIVTPNPSNVVFSNNTVQTSSMQPGYGYPQYQTQQTQFQPQWQPAVQPTSQPGFQPPPKYVAQPTTHSEPQPTPHSGAQPTPQPVAETSEHVYDALQPSA